MPPSENLLKPKVLLKSMDGVSTYHTYDAHDISAADINIERIDVTIGNNLTGTARVIIEDSSGTLNAGVINGAKVEIWASKDPLLIDADASKLFSGYIRRRKVNRNATNTLGYELTAYGTQVRFNERITNFFRMGDRSSFGSADPASDTTMRASELMIDLVDDTDHLPVGGPVESLTITGIDSITEQMPSIKEPFTEFTTVANRLTASTGTVWGVTPLDDVYMRYPSLTHSGITLSDAPASTDTADTGYIIGPWDYEDTIEKNEGFSNRLYGRGGTELTVDQSATTDAGTPNTLLDTDRAQAFTPVKHDLAAIQLKVSRVGTLSSDIEGEIRLDSSNNPTGDVVGTFKIWKDLVGTSATNVRVGVDIPNGGYLQVDKKHWIVLKENGTDVSNRARWHHDNGASGNSALRTPGGSGAWTVTSSGVKYCFATFSTRQILNEASSSTSIATYGVIESVLDEPWIIEGRMMDRYLTGIIEFSSKQKRLYNIPKVTAPDALFQTGKNVTIIDTKAGLGTSTQAELLSCRYSWNAYENGMGTKYVHDLEFCAYVA